MKHVRLQWLFLLVLLYPAYKKHGLVEVREERERSFLQAPKNAAAQNFTHVLEGKVSGWAAARANPSPGSQEHAASHLLFLLPAFGGHPEMT